MERFRNLSAMSLLSGHRRADRRGVNVFGRYSLLRRVTRIEVIENSADAST